MKNNNLLNQNLNNKTLNKNTGYTFLELLIVLAIISILSAVALPAYNSYINRAQISESLLLTSTVRNAIANYYKYTGRLPADNFSVGVSNSINSKYIQNVQVENGAIHVTFSNKNEQLFNKIITLRPVIVKNQPTTPIHFTCGYNETVQNNQKIYGKNKTNLEKLWLMHSCK